MDDTKIDQLSALYWKLRNHLGIDPGVFYSLHDWSGYTDGAVFIRSTFKSKNGTIECMYPVSFIGPNDIMHRRLTFAEFIQFAERRYMDDPDARIPDKYAESPE